MKEKFIFTLIIFSVLLFNNTFSKVNTDSLQERSSYRIKVFIDAGAEFLQYIKSEVTYIDYVRDIDNAELYIMIVSNATGSGGFEYKLSFTGEKRFTGLNDTITYYSKSTDTEYEIRESLLKKLQVGLLRYVEKTPLLKNITIRYTDMWMFLPFEDKWDNWIFTININGNVSGEKYTNSLALNGYTGAERVTDELKTSVIFNTSYSESNYSTESFEFKSVSRSYNSYALIVKSISNHLSVGGFGKFISSTYNNIKYGLNISPAVEYNLFPYSESANKQFIILYKIGYNYYNYFSETIYKKTTEGLFSQSLIAALNAKQKWGSAGISLTGSHYLESIKKNRIQFSGNLDIRLFTGLSLNLSLSLSLVHDQISLPRQGASEEEILLRQRQIETQYYYSGSIGFKYSFGSLFNNVVNTRFAYSNL